MSGRARNGTGTGCTPGLSTLLVHGEALPLPPHAHPYSPRVQAWASTFEAWASTFEAWAATFEGNLLRSSADTCGCC